ncbi:MAG TPA: ribosome silencing factor [Bacteroidota bacterium]|nr:ribosome silencing factor [Bacteroidota bacterium]
MHESNHHEKGKTLTPKALAKKIAAFALSKKAQDVVLLDLRKLTTMADYFVICSADSDTQVRAIADAIRDGAEKAGEQVWHDEGHGESTWVLLDFVDVVVHVFHKETRSFYNLEKLWGDAKFEHIEDKPAATTTRRKARLPKKLAHS